MKEYIVAEHPDFPYEEPKPQELIRCKDCKCWTKPHGWNGWCERGIPAEADDFCSWAERKEE